MQKIHYLCNYKSYLLWYRPSHVLAEHMTSHSPRTLINLRV